MKFLIWDSLLSLPMKVYLTGFSECKSTDSKNSWEIEQLIWLTLPILHLVLTLIINSVPTPILLSTLMWPPICSMIFLHIDKPSPVPWRFLIEFSSSLPKSINSYFLPSSEIPMPVSMTLICSWIHILSCSCSITCRSITSIEMETCPFLLVNLMAFDKKFIRIYMYRRWSPYIERIRSRFYLLSILAYILIFASLV